MNQKITHKKAVAMLKIAFTLALMVDLNAFIEYAKVEKPDTYTFYSPHNLPKIATSTAFTSESGVSMPVEEPEWFTGEFSAYTASESETDSTPTINASGQTVKTGDIACPKKYEFGTKIEVKGEGIFWCQDRMNERYREVENFDIFMWDLDEALAFGRKNLEYRIVDN